MVVAETLHQANDALELIEVEYEPLPFVTDTHRALAEDAPVIWSACPGNVCFRWEMGDKAATDRAFRGAARTVTVDLKNNRVTPTPIEPRAAIGIFNRFQHSYELYTSTQSPHTARRSLAQDVLHVEENSIRVIAPDVGGGFGLKGNIFPEEALVLWASKRCGRPVKWVATRSESMMGDRHARDNTVRASMALDSDGHILAIRSKMETALGAYTQGAFAAQAMFSLRLIPSAYRVPVVDIITTGVFTNTSPVASYRGPGRSEAIYLTERLLDQAAIECGISADEIRRRNLVPAAAMPYKTATGMVYDSGDFTAAMERGLLAADWDAYEHRRQESLRRGRLRGRGVSFYIEAAGIFNDRMDLRFDGDGGVVVVAGTFSHGQGHETVFPALVSEWLGIPVQKVRFLQGDTAMVGFGRGTFAARSALLGGSALRVAADEAIRKAKIVAANLLEADQVDLEFAEGIFVVRGTDRKISFVDVVKFSFKPTLALSEMGLGLDTTGTCEASKPSFPNGCHVCEVEIDPETGSVSLEKYFVTDDVGVPLNAMICEGQIHGGVVQGLGQALFEQIVYDDDSGQLISGSFQDYCMPRASDFSAIEVGFSNVPCTTNVLGVKGVGESGTVGAPPTAINAILDALRPLGVHHIDMPASPQRVRAAIAEARGRT
jgi:carbon-monoxide dehydrogenase large subunit